MSRTWLSQKKLVPCACTCGKRPKHFIEDMNFETRQRCRTCPQSKQNEVHIPTMGSTCQHWSLSSFLPRLLTPRDTLLTNVEYQPPVIPPGQEWWPRGS